MNVENVVNEEIKQILKNRLAEYGGNSKEAFTNLEDHPIWFNEEKGICIKSVIVKADVKDPIPLHKQRDRKGLILSDSKGEPVSVDFVKSNNNHHADIYVDVNGNLQEKMVSFFEAVQKTCNHQSIIDESYRADEGWRFLLSVQRYDYFILPDIENGFNPLNIDVCAPENYAIICPHLYRVQTVSSLDYRMRLHIDATNNSSNVLKGVIIERIRSLSNLIGSVKVSVDRLGRITSAQPITL